MAKITVVDEKTIKIAVDLEDAITMIREAEKNVERYAKDIVTIYEKMPEFQFVHFCFYAYDSAALFEHMLGVDPKQYLPFPSTRPMPSSTPFTAGWRLCTNGRRRCSLPS